MMFIIQKIRLNRPIQSSEIETLGKEFVDWNTKYSSLLSANSEYLIHKLYIHLNSISKKERSELVKSQEALDDLEKKLLKFYLALKNDLGIYAIVSPTAVTDFKSPATIGEVAKISGAEK